MKTILIIDDEPNFTEFLQLRLESQQYKVYTASDGVEGLEQAKAIKLDLILLDIMMRSMDGHTFIQKTKLSPELKKIPILVLSAQAAAKDAFEEEDIEKFMTKPIDSGELLKTVEVVINK